jgi:hypothetical protein
VVASVWRLASACPGPIAPECAPKPVPLRYKECCGS